MNNFEQFLVEFLVIENKRAESRYSGPRGSTRLSGDSKGDSTKNPAPKSVVQDKMAMVQAYFDANPDADGAAEHEKKGPDWVIPKKGKNKRKITNQVIVKKVSEEIRGTESKDMKWLKARMDKKKALDAKENAAKAAMGALAKSQPKLANAATGLMGLSIRKPKKKTP